MSKRRFDRNFILPV